jgi:D-alanine-D-alanine ligase
MSGKGMSHSNDGGIAVVCGGPGGEREVSLASGTNVHRALLQAGVENELVVFPVAEPEKALDNLSCRLAVLMFHGSFGEGGTVQRILERRGILFTGSDSTSAALAMDKDASKQVFVRNGIPTSAWAIAGGPGKLAAAVRERRLRYPLFVKPNSGGSSIGASRVEESGELAAAAELALAEDSLALAEELVPGRELTIGWLDGETLPIIELLADGTFYDYRAKYLSDATRYLCPADLPAETADAVRNAASDTLRAVGIRDIGRVDMMLGPDGPMVLEVNSLPGFTGHSLVPMAARTAGISLEKLCLRLVELAERREGERPRP